MHPLLLSVFGAMVAVYAGLVIFAYRTTRRVERLVPAQGTFLEVAGTRVHYVERGDGPVTILLIHGLAGNARHFTYRVLDALASSYRVIAIDRPGSGYTARPDGASATPTAQAELVAAFIRARGLDRPVLVGHSLGGAIALATAVAHPSLVRALALVAPLTQIPNGVPAVFAGLLIPNGLVRRAVGWTLAVPMSIARREEVLRMIFSPDPVPEDFGIAGGGLLGVRPAAFIAASSELATVEEVMPTLTPRYSELTMPVRVLYGTSDRILDPRLHTDTLQRALPSTAVEWVDGAGHMLPFTTPDRVVTFVRDTVEASH